MGAPFDVLIAVFGMYVLWTVVKPRWQFKIVVTPSGIEFVRGIPEARARTLQTFFVNDLKPTRKLTVCGRRGNGGRLIVSIRGADDEGVKQRIRNFLALEL